MSGFDLPRVGPVQEPEPPVRRLNRLVQTPVQDPTGEEPPPGVAALRADLQTMSQQADAQFLLSFGQAAKADPDLAAEAQRLGVEIGVDPRIVEQHVPKARHIWALKQAQQMRLAQTSPTLYRKLMDPGFARIAHDQLLNLSFLEEVLANWEAGQLTSERGILGRRVFAGLATAADQERLAWLTQRMADLPSRSGGLVSGAARMLGQQSVTLPKALATGAATGLALAGMATASGPAAPMTAPAAFGLGATFGTTFSLATQAYEVEAGNAFQDMVEMGLDRNAATRAAMGVGVVNAAMEMVGVGFVTKPVRAVLAREVAQGVAQALMRPSARSAGRQFAMDYLKALGGEIGTEIAQEVVNVAGEEVAAAGTDQARAAAKIGAEPGGDVDAARAARLQQGSDNVARLIEEGVFAAPERLATLEGRRPVVERLVDIAMETLRGMALLALPGPTFRLHHDLRRAAAAGDAEQRFRGLLDAAAATELKTRSPGSLEAFIGEAAQGKLERVHIDGAALREVLEQQGQDAQRSFAQLIPDAAGKVEEAAATGGDVVVPAEQFASRLAGTPLGAALLPHVRPNAEAMSAAQAKAFHVEQAELATEAQQLMRESMARDDEFVRSARAVEQQMVKDLVETGALPARDAQASAKLYRDFVVVQASRLGVTPEQFHAERGLQVERGQRGRGGVLNQVDVERQPSGFLVARSPEGQVGGHVRDGALHISHAEVQADKVGQGIGVTLYRALIDRALADGLRVFSDATVEPQAARVYEALRRRGYDVRRLEGGRLEDGVEFGKGAAAPAFEVVAGPAAPVDTDSAVRENPRYGSDPGPAAETNLPAREGVDDDRSAPGREPARRFARSDVSGTFATRTELSEQFRRRIGVSRVESVEDAAQALAYLGRGAVERLDALVTDQQGVPLAVVGGFKGGIAHALVDLPSLVMEAFRIAGATHLWVSHNHPSGSSRLSVEDLRVLDKLHDAFRGSQIQMRGMFAIAAERDGRHQWEFMSSDPHLVAEGKVQIATTSSEVPVIERVLTETGQLGPAITTPAHAMELVQSLSPGPGLFLLNNQNEPVAFVPVQPGEARQLRSEGRMDALYRAFSVANANAAIVVQDGGLSEGEVANLLRFLSSLNVRVLDVAVVGVGVLSNQHASYESFQKAIASGGTNFFAGNRRGAFDPATFTAMLFEAGPDGKGADASTFLHEAAHYFLSVYSDLAAQPNATDAMRADMQTLLDWFGVQDLASWNAMSLEEQRAHHETFAYNFELYLFEGKAPSLKLADLFRRFAAWLRQVYTSIRDDLNAIFRQEFGRDLPILTGEVRQVMDRMLASEEDIALAQAVRDMVPMFQTKEQAGMDDAAWADYQAGVAAATEAAVTDLTQASLRQMEWLSGARARVLKDLQQKHNAARKRVRDEVKGQVQQEPVYRAMHFLRTGDLDESSRVEGLHKLDLGAVREILGIPRERRLKPGKPKSLVTRIREMGGISFHSWETTWPGERVGEFRIPGVVRGKKGGAGMQWEHVARQLQSEGYGPQAIGDEAPDTRWLVDALADAASGLHTYREQDYADQGAAAAEPVRSAPEAPEALAARIEAETRRRREAVATLRRLGFGEHGLLADEGGLPPDAVAQIFGFSSGETLVRDLAAAAPLQQAIEERTDVRMVWDHSELVDPAAQDLAVEQALHNEARARFVAVELKHLAKATQPVHLMMRAAREAAEQAIARLPLHEIRPRDFALAEARAANAAAAARRKGDARAAIAWKRKQLLQHQMAAAAVRARREEERALRGFQKLRRSEEKLAKTRNVDLIHAARSILAMYGLDQGDRSKAYLDAVRAYDPALYADLEPMLRDAAQGTKPYRELTLDEFRDLRDTVEQLWWRSKRDNTIRREDQQIAISTAVDEMMARLDVPEVVPGERAALSRTERTGRNVMGVRANLVRVEHWALAMDGGKPGPWTRYIHDEIQHRLNDYRQERAVKIRQLADLLKQIDLPAGLIDATRPGELGYTFGAGNGGNGKAELLGAVLHSGNLSNLRKLVVGRQWGEGFEDRHFDRSRWDRFVARMVTEGKLTLRDFDFVQAVWDLTESMKPQAQKTNHDISGRYFDEVEAQPFTIVFPDGTAKELRGGYVPATPDRDLNPTVGQRTIESMAEDFRQFMPSARKGFTIRRTEVTLPLAIDVGRIAGHLDEVLLFSHVQPAIRDVAKILNHRDLKAALNRVDPTAIRDILMPWLDRTASQTLTTPGKNRVADAFWRLVRRNTGISIMFASVVNALQQFTGISNSLLYVKGRHLRGALARYLGAPRTTAAEVAARSKFMDDRMKNQVFGLREDIERMLLNPSLLSQAQQWVTRKAYFLQSAAQNQVDIVTWVGAFDQAAGAGETAADAVRAADKAVRLSQGSYNPEDVASYEVGTAFWRTWTQFSGYFNTVLNQIWSQQGATQKAKAALIAFTIPMLVSEAIVKTLMGTWDDEDDDGYQDELAAWFFGAQLRGAGALLPVAGPAVVNFVDQHVTGRPGGDRVATTPAMATLYRSVAGMTRAIAQAIDEHRDLSAASLRDSLTLLTLLTGVPLSALGKPVSFQLDVSAGRVDPTGPIDYTRGLITGRASENSRR